MKTLLIVAGVLFVVYYVWQHVSIKVDSDYDVVRNAGGLPKFVNVAEILRNSTATSGTGQKLVRVSLVLN